MASSPPLFETETPRARTTYVGRGGRKRVKGSRTTSVNLSADDRELLEQLAIRDDTSLNEVWRRALYCYAEQPPEAAARGEMAARA